MDNVEHLLVDLKESLERELGALRREMHIGFSGINQRFDTQAARLDRHAGLWRTGARWIGRMDVWAEKIDSALETKDREIAELRERLLRLERKLT